MSKWGDEEVVLLEELYKDNIPLLEISKKLNRTIPSIKHKCIRLGLTEKNIRSNSTNYKALYHDYDWFYKQYIDNGLSLKDIAKLCNASERVITKWADEKHHLNRRTYKDLKKLSDMQRRIITAGILGDGHITEKNYYIESHSKGEFDYIFWKYEILKDLCNRPPKYYNQFKDDKYAYNSFYRLNTRKINQLEEIKSLTRSEIIKQLDGLQLSCFLLDDGSRNNLWNVCVAEWAADEKDLFLKYIKDKFKITGKINKDVRYITFDADSSRKIDNIILNNVPVDLDIVKKKITNNKKIKKSNNSFYIIVDNERIGLGRYCKLNHIKYSTAKKIIDDLILDFRELKESDFLELIGDNNNEI